MLHPRSRVSCFRLCLHAKEQEPGCGDKNSTPGSQLLSLQKGKTSETCSCRKVSPKYRKKRRECVKDRPSDSLAKLHDSTCQPHLARINATTSSISSGTAYQ